MSFREAVPPEPPTRGSVPGPRWEASVPQVPCAPLSPNPGYATGDKMICATAAMRSVAFISLATIC